MKLERRKVLIIGLTVVTLISIIMVLYKSFANFKQEVTFPMNGIVIIKN